MNSTPTFTYHATEGLIDASARVADVEAAREVAALFPKSVKVRATTLSRPIDGDYRKGSETVGLVTFHASLRSTGTTGELNETGLKRWRSFLKHAERLGFPVDYTAPFANSLTPDEAAALGATR